MRGSLKALMYSFKGGAGRTVSTANIAYILAKEKRKRVLVVDLDVESAGASVLFNVDDMVENDEDRWAIQDVLRGYYVPPPREPDPSESRRKSINLNVKDFSTRIWPKLHFDIWPPPDTTAVDGAYLKLIPARRILYSSDEVKGGSSATSAFDFLMMRIDALPDPPDIILFDSASGLQDTALMGFERANTLLIFARWSRQFVKGSIQFVEKYVCSKVGRRLDRVFFVPTAVPSVKPTGRLAVELEERRKTLQSSIWLANDMATQKFGKPEGWIEIIDPPVSEADTLKWDDKILLGEGEEYVRDTHTQDLLSDYTRIADQLVTMASARKNKAERTRVAAS
jgi:MinD-like ATPase involved in chromosome partitioning or flagellar assembly